MSDGCVYFTTWTHYYAIRVKNVYNFHNNFYYFLYQNSFSNLGLKYRIWSTLLYQLLYWHIWLIFYFSVQNSIAMTLEKEAE